MCSCSHAKSNRKSTIISTMMKARSLLCLMLMACGVNAFLPPTVSRRQASTQLFLMDFLNNAKKQLVKGMAGNYDAAAIQARLNDLIGTHKVLMLSFTT